VRKRRSALYAYKVDQAHSHYLVMNGAVGNMRKAVVGFHGALEVDRESGEVLHLTYIAEVPKELKLDLVSTTVDYDRAEVGGRSYLLPVHSETEIHSETLSVKNDSDFKEYRKFSSESTIDYGVGK